MSQYVSTEDQEMVQVASNLGWSDFCDWAKTLDEAKYDELVAFCEDGDAYDLGYLAGQIRDALADCSPDDTVRSTAEGLLAFLADHEDAEMVMVSNGMVDPDEDSEDEPRDANEN